MCAFHPAPTTGRSSAYADKVHQKCEAVNAATFTRSSSYNSRDRAPTKNANCGRDSGPSRASILELADTIHAHTCHECFRIRQTWHSVPLPPMQPAQSHSLRAAGIVRPFLQVSCRPASTRQTGNSKAHTGLRRHDRTLHTTRGGRFLCGPCSTALRTSKQGSQSLLTSRPVPRPTSPAECNGTIRSRASHLPWLTAWRRLTKHRYDADHGGGELTMSHPRRQRVQ
jgi:hypothetical protein